jgi:nucleoside-diphosphate-sugar epimerase
MPEILLVGASGFIGSKIFDALNRMESVHLRILTRRSSWSGLPGGRAVVGDVTDPRAVSEAVQGVDTVVNASSYVGRDPVLARQVNLDGTRNLLDACDKYGVQRFVQLSTTAVYGSGPHLGPSPSALPHHPESPASMARSAAETHVLEAGGSVIRPNLVYGEGDRWFIPSLIRMFQTLNATIDEGRAELSLIDATTLGELAALLAVKNESKPAAFHACDPRPVRLAEILNAVDSRICPLDLKRSLPLREAISLLSAQDFSSHQVNMIGTHHWYQSDELYRETGIQPRGFRLGDQTNTAWYRQFLEHPHAETDAGSRR